jgi:superfamily II DNA or RNA helicase
MTATPERTDGNDIFQLFDHNIAYEIRLNRAMEEETKSISLLWCNGIIN